MGNKEWNTRWKEHIKDFDRLMWIPNTQDSKRVKEIQKELNAIVDRNTKEE